ncbi:hypothetical protein BC937DRAFT_92356 [Endogone sp. FLAS-F59071]|nr:hypothetical protein BC937DRAFT_92356 [Endogone sp. FLAS-F59071]|eukprot:RUS15519.1 hypothetical protein BC937DRAFT_92356 [Endogone sp. FLAS-F59071]
MVHTVKAFGVDSVNDLLQKDINTKAISVAKFREHKEPKESKSAKDSKDGPPKPSKAPKLSTSATAAPVASTLPKPIEKVFPPSFQAIELMYSEPILWQRIQLRQFLFRFGSLLKLEKKHIRLLDDAQHKWTQDFCTAVVTAMLKTIVAGDSNTETLIDVDAASQALKEVSKPVQGITDRGWNAVAELLRLLGVEGVPEGILRGSDSSSITAATVAPAIEKRVTRGATTQPTQPKPSARVIPNFSESDQLVLINFLGECVLSTDLFRRALANAPDALRVYEEALRRDLKKFKFQESLDNGARKALVMVLKEMRVRKDAEAVEKAQHELAVFEESVGKKQKEIEMKRVELMGHEERLARRVEPVGRDVRGNVYWRFADLTEGQKSLFSSSWGQSLVVVGMGCADEKEKDEQGDEAKEGDKKKEIRWWFVKGMEDVERLKKWVEYEALEKWGPKRKRLVRKKVEVTEAKNSDPTVTTLNSNDDEVNQNYGHDHDNGEIHQNSFASDKTSRTLELDIGEVPFAIGLTVAAEEPGDEEEDQMTEEGVTRKEVQKLAEALEEQAMWLRVMGIKSDQKEEGDDNGEKSVEKDG